MFDWSAYLSYSDTVWTFDPIFIKKKKKKNIVDSQAMLFTPSQKHKGAPMIDRALFYAWYITLSTNIWCYEEPVLFEISRGNRRTYGGGFVGKPCAVSEKKKKTKKQQHTRIPNIPNTVKWRKG